MIVDSHCHAWERWPYEPSVPDHESRSAVEQLLYEMDLSGVDQATIVCAAIDHNPQNNTYVGRVVSEHPERLHQIADLDCHWSDTYHSAGAADRLRELCDRFPIKGFTHYVRGDDDGWLTSDDGLAMFAVATERGLLASIAAPPGWQRSLRAVAQRFESLPILCHHLAGLRPTDEHLHSSLREVMASAASPNILVKLSGFRYAAALPYDYPYSDVEWIIRTLYETFGPRRLCWGSNFPVERPFTTYRQTIEVLRTHSPFISDDDADLILGRTLAELLSGDRNFD